MGFSALAAAIRAAFITRAALTGAQDCDELTAHCEAIAEGFYTDKSPIDTLANLALLPTEGLADGDSVYVNETEDIYVFESSGSHTEDGLCVIEGADGGYWVARHAGRWDDLPGDISQGTALAALTYEAYRDTPKKSWFWRHNQPDELHYTYQNRHRWKRGTKLFPHIHFRPCGAIPGSAGNFAVSGYYGWSDPDNALPALSGWTPFNASYALVDADQYKTKILSLVSGGITPPAWAKESSILEIYMVRASGGADTYTAGKDHGTAAANVGLVSSDVHFQSDKLGTETEIPS